jgi:hypothetical protein
MNPRNPNWSGVALAILVGLLIDYVGTQIWAYFLGGAYLAASGSATISDAELEQLGNALTHEVVFLTSGWGWLSLGIGAMLTLMGAAACGLIAREKTRLAVTVLIVVTAALNLGSFDHMPLPIWVTRVVMAALLQVLGALWAWRWLHRSSVVQVNADR